MPHVEEPAAFNAAVRGGKLVASFPIDATDGLLLVTSGGQLIRTNVTTVRIASRNTQGVTIFRTAAGERVVSVERLVETAEDVVDETPEGPDEAPAVGGEALEGRALLRAEARATSGVGLHQAPDPAVAEAAFAVEEKRVGMARRGDGNHRAGSARTVQWLVSVPVQSWSMKPGVS